MPFCVPWTLVAESKSTTRQPPVETVRQVAVPPLLNHFSRKLIFRFLELYYQFTYLKRRCFHGKIAVRPL